MKLKHLPFLGLLVLLCLRFSALAQQPIIESGSDDDFFTIWRIVGGISIFYMLNVDGEMYKSFVTIIR